MVVGGDRRDLRGTAMGFANASLGEGDGDNERSLEVSLHESEANIVPNSMMMLAVM